MVIPHFVVLFLVFLAITEESLDHIIIDWMIMGILNSFKACGVFLFLMHPVSPVVLVNTFLLLSFLTFGLATLLGAPVSFAVGLLICGSTFVGISISIGIAL
jgi:hypothetical protein